MTNPTTELKRAIAIDASSRRRAKERAAVPDLPSFTDDQLMTIKMLASTLPIEKRDCFLQRVIAHLQLVGASRPTPHQLDVALNVAMRGLLHTGEGNSAA